MPESDRLSTSATAAFWAKTGIQDSSTEENKESLSEGLSLVQHMLDTGSVAARLWDTWLAPGLQKRFSEHLKLSMADTRALVCWLAATHDMGKATPEFACQFGKQEDGKHLSVYRERIEQEKFDIPEGLIPSKKDAQCPHSKYSQSILIDLLTKML